MKINTKKGFTLIEVLVVVLIIGILSSVALPQYTRSVERARLTEALVTLNSLRKAINVYTSENGFQYGTYFIGAGATAALDVDLEEGMDCESTDHACIGKYFKYVAFCTNISCIARAQRINSSRGTYVLTLTKYRSTRKWADVCTSNEDGDMGDYICGKILPKQGWTVGSSGS